jgi:membrane protease YdiL (CAAX protease family)
MSLNPFPTSGPGLRDPEMERWMFRSSDGRLRAGWRVAAFVPACVAVMLAGTAAALPLLVAVYRSVVGNPAVTPTQFMHDVPYAPLLWTASGVPAAIILVWVFRRYLDRRSWVSIGFQGRPNPVPEVVAGALLGLLTIALTVAPMALSGHLQWISPARTTQTSGSELPLMLGTLLVAAFGEELVVRGYVLGNLREAIGTVPALLISAGLFAALHLVNPEVSPVALVNLFLAGLLMGGVYVVTGRLWGPWLLHTGWNVTLGLVLGLPVSGLAMPSLLHLQITGSSLTTGGAFGPEGSLWNTAAQAVILLLLCVLGRRLFGRPRDDESMDKFGMKKGTVSDED